MKEERERRERVRERREQRKGGEGIKEGGEERNSSERLLNNHSSCLEEAGGGEPGGPDKSPHAGGRPAPALLGHSRRNSEDSPRGRTARAMARSHPQRAARVPR